MAIKQMTYKGVVVGSGALFDALSRFPSDAALHKRLFDETTKRFEKHYVEKDRRWFHIASKDITDPRLLEDETVA